jgi:hypothetical protein
MVDGPNRYAFVRNNPTNLVDPWGLCGNTEKNTQGTSQNPLILTDQTLTNEYNTTYNRLQEMSTLELYNPYKEATFDTNFHFMGEANFIYNGTIYTGNEVNYIGIGMYENAKGDTLGQAKLLTTIWKYINYQTAPSKGTMEWLENGYDAYSNINNGG